MMEIFLEIKGILAVKPLSIFFHDDIEVLEQALLFIEINITICQKFMNSSSF